MKHVKQVNQVFLFLGFTYETVHLLPVSQSWGETRGMRSSGRRSEERVVRNILSGWQLSLEVALSSSSYLPRQRGGDSFVSCSWMSMVVSQDCSHPHTLACFKLGHHVTFRSNQIKYWNVLVATWWGNYSKTIVLLKFWLGEGVNKDTGGANEYQVASCWNGTSSHYTLNIHSRAMCGEDDTEFWPGLSENIFFVWSILPHPIPPGNCPSLLCMVAFLSSCARL